VSFVEIQFPADISYGSSGGPTFSTDVIEAFSGFEQRNINWSAARARYNVAHGVKTQSQLDELIAFFRARQGKAIGFRFKDWTDYQATTETLGTGDGVTNEFQLVKRYASGGATELRAITKPVSGTVQVFRNAALVSSGVSVNTATGKVTFAAPPATGVVITSSFQFDVPVRFDTDRLAATLESYGVNSWLDIPLVEVRV
jgi:uncharacterized protein (TIGR02217 family)